MQIGDGHVLQSWVTGCPAITGGNVHTLNAGRLCQFPSQSVLSPTGTNDQDLHGLHLGVVVDLLNIVQVFKRIQNLLHFQLIVSTQ